MNIEGPDLHGYFQSLESEIEKLRADLPGVFLDDKDAEHYNSFIGAGEYGLAFEELTCSALEKNISVSLPLYKRIESIAELMKISDDHWKAIKVF